MRMGVCVCVCVCVCVFMRARTWAGRWARGYPRLLTGNEEGVFGWIAANYVLGALPQPPRVITHEPAGAS